MPGDRTEQATSHRKDKARKDGDILHSRELTTAAGTLAGVLTLGVLWSRSLNGWRAAFGGFLALGSSGKWDTAELGPTLIALRRLTFEVLTPICVVMMAVAIGALGTGLIQTGGINMHAGSVGFKLDRINPLTNAKTLFSLRAVSRLGKSMLPVALLSVFAVQRIARQMEIPPFSTARLELLGADVFGLLEAATWLLFGWALIDYILEWRSRESRLKMSKQDLRDEMKETEGSPQIRSRIRGLQRQMRRRKVKADVSRAAVVVTNPTHYAIALGFDFATMEAPRVLAKGRNLLAEEIKAEARWAGVPIIENPPLARSLYKSAEAGQAIPVDLYAAVASILAYLYRQRVDAELRERRAREAARVRNSARMARGGSR
ncbi:MAG TPA: EscU/YscU/HrcU family type III secretion system export apparatus switch protein [Terracidiphilus sp.]